MKIRQLWAATALIFTGFFLITDQGEWAVVAICVYVASLFVRDYLARRARDQAWAQAGGSVYRVKGRR